MELVGKWLLVIWFSGAGPWPEVRAFDTAHDCYEAQAIAVGMGGPGTTKAACAPVQSVSEIGH